LRKNKKKSLVTSLGKKEKKNTSPRARPEKKGKKQLKKKSGKIDPSTSLVIASQRSTLNPGSRKAGKGGIDLLVRAKANRGHHLRRYQEGKVHEQRSNRRS